MSTKQVPPPPEAQPKKKAAPMAGTVLPVFQEESEQEREKNERAYLEKTIKMQRESFMDIIETFKEQIPGIMEVFERPVTLKQCIIAAYPAVVRRNAGTADELADKAVEHGQALYNKLQAL